MALAFIGFVGRRQHLGGLSLLASATLGATITTWATFAPCFRWILLGTPYLDSLRKDERLTSMLSATTAAVMGVVPNLPVWAGPQVLFAKPWQPDFPTTKIAAIAFAGMQRWKWDGISVGAQCGCGGNVRGESRWMSAPFLAPPISEREQKRSAGELTGVNVPIKILDLQ
jgi:Chromate transporter